MSLITVLRPAAPHDCEHIYNAHQYSVQYTCARSYNDQILNAWRKLLSPDSYLDTMSNPNKALWVVEYRGNIQGFFQLDLKDAQLDALYVHPFVHNQGLGTALLQRAEELAIDAGLSLIKLYASLNSVTFYNLNGYESLGSAVLPLNREVKVECELMRKYL
ncbi:MULTISPECIES: GNAT family N-acetyltransferase [unclassified Neisseria]|uniref:GNAT family N-acetyltransferase n=1 Tax=unclassified Neisseria TaxID=2623750 RepID=UPI00266634AF|nr:MULTISPECIES: GNAT family N-acetyltransferase [unclassified Neisseria]MDO1509221.1 GNAT family N-acetyltransferase [Neisseria sp. MVDL19-042950]MDO1515500.1 GNAT family N-acetyltransferase [Neisseria sp. MVDL18-041461]MDO1562859.1 GNAT family N-acetyltransferase [Neisseria sp. MVDL20-010259]